MRMYISESNFLEFLDVGIDGYFTICTELPGPTISFLLIAVQDMVRPIRIRAFRGYANLFPLFGNQSSGVDHEHKDH